MTALLSGGSFLALSLAGLLSLGIATGRLGAAPAPDLTGLENHLGPLVAGASIPFAPEVLGELPPESHVFLDVVDENGRRGELFAAWYARDRRWSGRPHDLVGCFAVLGYDVESVEHVVTESGARVWLRTFRGQAGGRRVVHWLQRPGAPPGASGGRGILGRLTEPRGLRQDVVSIYLAFDAEDAPDPATLRAAAGALVQGLGELLEPAHDATP